MSLLLAFEAAAKHQSFARAAEELSLTQSAVSRQVGVLEKLLQIELFQRQGKRIWLTDAGQMYAQSVANALDRLRGASLQAMSLRTDSRALRLALLPTFGSKWLLPRLHRFYESHPNIIVHIHTRVAEISDFEAAGVDAAISVRDMALGGPEMMELCPEDLVPVMSPQLFRKSPVISPSDLERHLLLHVGPRPQQWPNWFSARGLQPRNMSAGPHFEVTGHLIQAIVAGIGVGLVPLILVQEELRQGEVIIPLPGPLPGSRSYCFAYPAYNSSNPQLIAFREWLRSERDSLLRLRVSNAS
ncbi:LysR substrate-binding domain-containing protein [Paucibacter sp. O1-1]|nr:LysR substrate-binding domain-containing protein [Paucibacter sp. O1-1]MDA3825043.1 LysR substrate-binding domain-containing protein [Paucibacter sp. O1-1]